MATENEDTKSRSESEVVDEKQGIEGLNTPPDLPNSMNAAQSFTTLPPESNASPIFTQTAQQATGKIGTDHGIR